MHQCKFDSDGDGDGDGGGDGTCKRRRYRKYSSYFLHGKILVQCYSRRSVPTISPAAL